MGQDATPSKKTLLAAFISRPLQRGGLHSHSYSMDNRILFIVCKTNVPVWVNINRVIDNVL